MRVEGASAVRSRCGPRRARGASPGGCARWTLRAGLVDGALLALVLLPGAAAHAAQEEPEADLAVWVWRDTRFEHVAASASPPLEPEAVREALFAAFGCSLGPESIEQEEDEAWIGGVCPGLFERRWPLRLAGRWDVRPLARAVREAGGGRLAVAVGSGELPLGRMTAAPPWQPSADPESDTEERWRRVVLDTSAAAVPPLEAEIGYDTAWFARRVALALGALLLPVALLLAFRRRELRGPAPDPAVAWFGTLRRVRRYAVLGFLLWVCLYPALEPWGPVRMLLAGGHVAAAFALGLLLPPWLLAHLLSRLSRPLFDRMDRGEVVRELQERALWASVLQVAPILALLFGVLALPSPRAAALWILAAPCLYVVAAGRLLGRSDMAPHAVSSGELRDRVFGLAAQRSVTLRQLFVIPGRRAQLANAFALGGGRVVLTDFLLQTLDRRELDAVIAHEVAHLVRRHPAWLGVALTVPTAGVAIAGIAAAERWGYSLGLHGLLVLVWAGGLLAFLALSRRFERTADADAVEQTGDAAGLIRGLARLTRANLLPRTWGRSRFWLTHPSLEERARLAARRGGLAEEQALELMGDESPPTSRYATPEVDTAEQRVFTTSFKSMRGLRVALATLALVGLLPAAWVLAVGATASAGPLRVAALVLGLPVTALVLHASLQRLAASGYRALGRRLAERLGEEGLDVAGATFAGLAPGPAPRFYEGLSDWDVGFLTTSREALVWLGDHQRFALPRERVSAVELADGIPGWRNERRVWIGWRDGAETRWMSLKAADVASVGESRRRTEALRARLDSWWRGESGGAPSGPDLPAPDFGEVTSDSVRKLVGPRAAIASLVLAAVAGLLASLLLGLPFPDGGAWAGLGAALLVLWLALPGLRYREPGRGLH